MFTIGTVNNYFRTKVNYLINRYFIVFLSAYILDNDYYKFTLKKGFLVIHEKL